MNENQMKPEESHMNEVGGGSEHPQIESRTSAPSTDKFLPVSILIAAVMISTSVLYATFRSGGAPAVVPSGNNQPSANAAAAQAALLEVRERDTILGDPNAPVTIIEYGDYQCPFCGRFFTETEPFIKESYVKTNKVRMIYRDLAFLGPESVEAAKSAECAKDQGKFWQYHDALFAAEIKDGAEHNGNLNKALFVATAEGIKMNVADFTSCLDANTYAAEVDAVNAAARAAGVNATPMSFVGKELIQGAQPYAVFKATIDKQLADK